MEICKFWADSCKFATLEIMGAPKFFPNVRFVAPDWYFWKKIIRCGED